MLTKIEILVNKRNFHNQRVIKFFGRISAKFFGRNQSFSQKSKFWTKIEMLAKGKYFGKTCSFGQKSRFLTKNGYFLSEKTFTKYFGKRSFGQKLTFWTKNDFFWQKKNRIFFGKNLFFGKNSIFKLCLASSSSSSVSQSLSQLLSAFSLLAGSA